MKLLLAKIYIWIVYGFWTVLFIGGMGVFFYLMIPELIKTYSNLELYEWAQIGYAFLWILELFLICKFLGELYEQCEKLAK